MFEFSKRDLRMITFNAFTITTNEENIAVVTLDLPNESINKLSSFVIDELEEVIQELSTREELIGALFISGKKNIFIAGADIHEIFEAQSNISKGRAFLRRGQKVFNQIEKLPFPVCAVIDGACMGGGMEFALACDFRIGSTNPKTILALPEVKLGIMPGWGGTQRMSRLIGLPHAIDIFCSGRNVYYKEAYQIGLIDDYNSSELLMDTTIQLIKDSYSKGTWKGRREEMNKAIQVSDGEKLSIFNLARENINKNHIVHIDAPLRALDAIKEGYSLPLKDGLEIELNKIDILLEGEVSRNLIKVFFSQKSIEKEKWVSIDIIPQRIGFVGVVGAGIMGSGIAYANLIKNIPVIIKDLNDDIVTSGVERTINIFSSYVNSRKLSSKDAFQKSVLLSGSLSYDSIKNCDLIIEAVIEDKSIKKKVFVELEKIVSNSTIIATNTTSISINELSECLQHKERFVGLHFFNPVQKMPLVEVIRSKYTSDQTISTVVNYVRSLDKTPIVVNDGVGFIVSRLLFIYLNEASLLINEGVDINCIEKEMISFGMPMGPLSLLDLVGIDVAYKSSLVLMKGFPERYLPSIVLEKLYNMKRYGVKSGKGFFIYDTKKGKQEYDDALYETLKNNRMNSELSSESIQFRLLLPMILEAGRILEDGISNSVRDIDMALILGINFPPFKGGLLRFADLLGIKEILRLSSEYVHLGKRFEPCQLLIDMLNKEKSFYNDEE